MTREELFNICTNDTITISACGVTHKYKSIVCRDGDGGIISLKLIPIGNEIVLSNEDIKGISEDILSCMKIKKFKKT